jgi:hypothetical protein
LESNCGGRMLVIAVMVVVVTGNVARRTNDGSSTARGENDAAAIVAIS